MSDTIVLGFRYNEFLLQRAMVKRAQINNRELISVSREVFSIVLNILHHNSRGQYAYDMPWVVRLLGTEAYLPKADTHIGRRVCAASRRRFGARALAAMPPSEKG